MNQSIRQAVTAVLLAVSMVAGVVATATGADAQTSWTTPRYLRSIGGMGRPGVFSWGVQWNPVTNEILVADYLHFKVRRYDLNGNHLGDFWRDNAFGQPYTIGVDPTDGDIYVAELKDNPLRTGIAKYDKNGNFLYATQGVLSTAPERRTFTDGVLTAGSTTLTSATAAFSSSFDVGAKLSGTGIPSGTIVASRTNSTTVVMSQAATESSPAATVEIDPFPTGFKRIPLAGTTAGSTTVMSNLFASGDVGLRVTGPGIPDGTTIVSRTTTSAELSQAATQTGNVELRVIPASASHRAFYTVWMTVEEDTGDVFVLDSHYQNYVGERPRILQLRFDDALKNVTTENAFVAVSPDIPDPEDCTNEIAGCDPRMYGIDIVTNPGGPHNDEIYVSDAWNRRAYRFSKSGQWLATFGQGPTGGDNRGVVVNETLNRAYLVDAENSQVDVFNMDGQYLNSFGSEGSGAGQFTGGGRAIDIDGSGNVWVADFGGFETEKYSPTGTPLLTAPSPARKPPIGLLGQPRDVSVDDTNGDVWVADAWNQRFVRFSSTGTHLGTWGTRGPGGPFDMNYPRHIAVQPENTAAMPGTDHPKRIWIGQERGHHLQVYNAPTTTTGSPTYVAQIGLIGADDIEPNHFRWPVDIEFYTRPDGTEIAIIGDRMASSVKFFNAVTFQEILNPNDTTPDDGAPMIPRPNHGTAVDPATGNVYVVNPSNDRIEVYDQSGSPVNNWLNGSTPVNYFGSTGTGPGQMRDPVDGVISNGVLYVSDESQSKVSAFSLTGTYLGRWGTKYGTDTYDFRGAVGLDADSQGLIYVTDTYNDRIQVFNPAQARTYETTAPSTPTYSSPAQGAVLPLAPVSLTGTATDNTSVGNVEISIQDYTTGLWWNGNNNSWEAAKTTTLAGWSSNTAPATSVTWRYTFLGVSAQGRYLVEARTRDHNGNVSGNSAVRTFAMTGATAPPLPTPPVNDNTRPNGTLTFPTAGAQLPYATVTFAGQATDNVGVSTVKVALKRLSDGRWWNGGTSSGGFGTAYTAFDATLDTPGGTATGWTWEWTPRATGDYQILVEARDAAGNVDSTKPLVSFTVTSNPPDTTPPDTVVSTPAEGASVPTGPVVISGSATDNTAIGSVKVGIQNTATSQWWTGSGWTAAATTVNATLSAPNTAATNWSYTFNAPSAGSYAVTATAYDTSNLPDASPATVSFTSVGSPDTTAPDGTLAVPTNNGTYPLGPITMSGNATDNTGVTSVRIAIRNNSTLQWWNGTAFGSWTYVQATLDNPGGTSTGWTYEFNPPATGSYGVQVTAVDGAGNTDPTRPWRNFTVN